MVCSLHVWKLARLAIARQAITAMPALHTRAHSTDMNDIIFVAEIIERNIMKDDMSFALLPHLCVLARLRVFHHSSKSNCVQQAACVPWVVLL